MEELFLGPFLAGDELNIVEKKDIDASEGLAECLHLLSSDAVDVLVDKLLGGHIGDLAGRIGSNDPMGDGVKKVCLSKAGAAVNIERVVRFAGSVGDGLGRGGCELIGRALDEAFEDKARDEGVGGEGGTGWFRGAFLVLTRVDLDLELGSKSPASDGFDVAQ